MALFSQNTPANGGAASGAGTVAMPAWPYPSLATDQHPSAFRSGLLELLACAVTEALPYTAAAQAGELAQRLLQVRLHGHLSTEEIFDRLAAGVPPEEIIETARSAPCQTAAADQPEGALQPAIQPQRPLVPISVLRLGTASQFQSWLEDKNLPKRDRRLIEARLGRLQGGNLSSLVPITDSYGPLLEARLFIGPGYRIYLVRHGDALIIVRGGIKTDQARDVVKAQDDWRTVGELSSLPAEPWQPASASD